MRKPNGDATLLAGLAVAMLVASLPAWTGDWIYDDWAMRANDKMDGWDDALAVFGRSSAAYLGDNAASQVGVVTYRPLSMLSLIALQTTFPDSALAQHSLSLLLHLANTCLLFWTVRALRGAPWARVAAVTFGLHPLGIEAYGWINGRSDVLAALGVLLAAHALFGSRADPHASTWGLSERVRLGQAASGSLLAALSKETALLALFGLACASLFGSRAEPRASTVASRPAERERAPFRARLSYAMACLSGTVVALALRAVALGDVQKVGSSLGELPDLARGLARVAVVAAESMLLPLPRTMANLGFRLAEPLSTPELLLLFALVALPILLAVRRYLRASLLIATAFIMVLPCVAVRHTFWLGGDRYFYIPLALLCLGLSEAPLPARLAGLVRSRVLWGVTGGAAFLLALSSYVTAQTYHSQSDHMLAMMRMRPDDPSGYLIGARWLWHRGQKPGALELLGRMPRERLPPALASQLATVLSELGQTGEALAVVADMERRYPRDPFVRLDVVAVRLDEGRIAEAARLAGPLRSRPGFCRAVRGVLAAHLERPGFSREHGAEARALLVDYRCP